MSPDVARWWPLLPAPSREWPMQHNGEPIPPDVGADLAAVGGPSDTVLADELVDWIEAVANGERPDAPSSA